ncbi:hypothetical protein GWK08_07340 [Leptobacterium flavescens]|uniref:O-antigen ligase-related domain-containing protein n=1 Tax=Leptobacterium flavescens TaxID=472055 RepID=A0A6P0UMY9_9FLAO|nr:O-antigen ligase family protein [Leptobacterium flavescens]NER13248.1 hypothetical protein [Leptobacterium flavescens]
MKNLFLQKKDVFSFFLVCLFFVSIVLTPNSVNSKVIIITLLYSLFFFNWRSLKTGLSNHYPLLLFFIICSLSLLYSDNLSLGLKRIERLTILPVSILIFSFLPLKRSSLTNILKFYVVVIFTATIYSHIITIITFINNNEPHLRNIFKLNYSYLALGKTIGLHPAYYSLYILTAIIILFHFFKKSKLLNQIFVVLGILYLSFFIIHLSSRTSIVILYVIILFNLITFLFKKKKILRGFLFLALFHIFAYLAITNIGTTKYRFQHIFGFTYYTGYTVNDGDHKLKLWSAAFHANKNVFWGNGIGDVQKALNEQYELNNLEKPLNRSYNSHNQYIEYYVGMGVMGLLAFLYILFYYLKNFYQRRNLIGLQFIISTSLLYLVECVWNRHNGIVFICFMIGLLWKLNSDYEEG